MSPQYVERPVDFVASVFVASVYLPLECKGNYSTCHIEHIRGVIFATMRYIGLN